MPSLCVYECVFAYKAVLNSHSLASWSILFRLDEPTSGLDSFAATQLMELLQRVANAGSTVLFTIHQPSSDTFFSFDKMILLDEGRVMYHGKTENVVSDFAKLGYPVKEHTNPAEWMLSVAQIHSEEQLEKDGFFPKDERLLEVPITEEMPKGRSCAPFGTQVGALLEREVTTKKRVVFMVLLNASIAVVVGFFSGFLFQGIGADDRNDPFVLQALIGVYVNALLNAMMGQSSAALLLLPQERPLFLREYTTKTYSVPAFVLVKLLNELFDTLISLGIQCVMIYFLVELRVGFFIFFGIALLTSLSATSVASLLGSACTDPQFATAMFPLVILPQFYFSGVLVPLSFIPAWLRWMHYLCSLYYAMALSLIYEFDNCDSQEEQTCDAILDRQEINTSFEPWYWIIFISIISVFKILSVFVLKSKAQY